jgi:hypothetical protein
LNTEKAGYLWVAVSFGGAERRPFSDNLLVGEKGGLKQAT